MSAYGRHFWVLQTACQLFKNVDPFPLIFEQPPLSSHFGFFNCNALWSATLRFRFRLLAYLTPTKKRKDFQRINALYHESEPFASAIDTGAVRAFVRKYAIEMLNK